MVHFMLKYKSFIWGPSRNLKALTYENDVRMTDTKITHFIRRVLYSSNSFSHNQKEKYSIVPNTFLMVDLSSRQVSRITAKNSSFTQRNSSLALKSGILIKRALFENSCHFASTKLNNRYQSTTATSVNEPLTVEISESADKAWFFSHSGGLEYVLKDISESPLAEGFQSLLGNVNTTTGLPWWGTIILTTVILRTLIIFPFAVHQRRILIKLENAQREIEDVIHYTKQEISMAVKNLGWPVEFARTKYQEKVRNEWNDVFRREKTHPVKACALIAVQSTTWMGMSIALANMCCTFPHSDPAKEVLYSEMTSGGPEWIQNLAVADNSLILPFSVGLMNLSIIGVNYLRLKELNIVQKLTLGSLTIISLGMIPLAMELPSGLVLYWTVSSGCGLVFNLLLTIPTMRSILRIPEVKSDVQREQEVAEWIAARKNSENGHKKLMEDKNLTEGEGNVGKL